MNEMVNQNIEQASVEPKLYPEVEVESKETAAPVTETEQVASANVG